METVLSTLLVSALLAAAELVTTKLVQRWMTVAGAPAALPLGFVTG